MSLDHPVVLRVGTPRELLESLPHLVGFVPYDSLVLVLSCAVAGSSRERVALTVRFDLPTRELPEGQRGLSRLGDSDEFAAAVHRAVTASGASTAFLVAWGPAPRDTVASSDLPSFESRVSADVSAGAEALSGLGVHVRDALVVSGDRFRSLLCSDSACCPVEGTDLSPTHTSAASAHIVASGLAMPASNRGELEGDVAGDATRVAATAAALGDAASLPTVALVRPEAIPRLPQPRTQVRQLAEAMGAWHRTGDLPSGVMAAIAVALGRGMVREHAVRWMVDGVDGIDQRRFWLYVARGLPAPFDAAALALTALAALLEGNGAAANIAWDRSISAVKSAPEPVHDNVFAVLVDNVGFLVNAGCGPEVARAVLSSAYDWFTPVAVPGPDSTAPVSRASNG